MFQPIRTDRLLLRRARLGDAEALWRRRNEPTTAELQAWALPYTRDQAQALIERAAADEEPVDGEWFMITIADPADNEVFGDLVLKLKWDGRSAEIGYTLGADHWGKGLATEAANALVDWLLAGGRVTRVEAYLHPDNLASARLLERLGMKLEGLTRNSFWVGDENSDDLLYGMTREMREAWTGRKTTSPEQVRLVEIDWKNSWDYLKLETHHSQRQFVTHMAGSFTDALFPEEFEGDPMTPWLRGVEADGEPAGFVMLATPTELHPTPFLWRLLVDRMHQRRGIGKRVLDLAVDQVRQWGVNALETSWTEGHGSPRSFYEKYGFVTTGRIVDGETEARLSW